MKIKFKYFNILTLSIIGISPLTTFACQVREEKLIDLPKHEYFISKKLQDSVSRKHVNIDHITRNEIKNASNDILSRERATQVSGGYGEMRHFYIEDGGAGTPSLHLGVDTFLHSGTEIYSPVDGEIIASYWVRDNNDNYASGIGGIVAIKTKIENLNIDDNLKEMLYVNFGSETSSKISKVPKMQYIFAGKEYLPSEDKLATEEEYENHWESLKQVEGADTEMINYQKAKEDYIILTFMHLSQNTPSIYGSTIDLKVEAKEYKYAPIDINNPQTIKKGDLIGYVGHQLDNGGWRPHVHLENFLYGYSSRFQTREENYKVVGEQLTGSGPYMNLKPVGTFLPTSESRLEQATNRPWEIMTSGSWRMVDPNNLYQLYNDNDIKIKY